ncbi:MAG TPA: response regulator [Cytophagales bacterium]|nr:response regulator [Cytophagales bacterium]
MNSKGQAKIFIVEDNFMFSYVLDSVLKDYGNFKITTCATGEECIQMLGNNPDIVIMDYNLGSGMNGLETLKAIRAKKPKLPVIILSGQNDIKIAAELFQAGAYDYIEKKGQKETLDKLINSIVNAN